MWCNRDQLLGEPLLARPGQRLHTVGQEGCHWPTTAPQAPELPALVLGMAWTVFSKSPYFSAASWPPGDHVSLLQGGADAHSASGVFTHYRN